VYRYSIDVAFELQIRIHHIVNDTLNKQAIYVAQFRSFFIKTMACTRCSLGFWYR